MGKRHGTCTWCNEFKKLTTHHIKNRLGDKEEIYDSRMRLKFITMWVCRKCHDEIESDYILTGRVIPSEVYMKETTLYGIENNLYVKMSLLNDFGGDSRRLTKEWIEKKIDRVYNKSYYAHNKQKHINLIMKLAIALNDIHVLYPKYKPLYVTGV